MKALFSVERSTLYPTRTTNANVISGWNDEVKGVDRVINPAEV